MFSSADIEVLTKVVKTLTHWSGIPPDAEEDEVIIQGDMAKDDITYGDLIILSNLVQELKNLRLKKDNGGIPDNMRVLGDLRRLKDSMAKVPSEEDKEG